ncbi:hypothetical protein PI124_g23840, partial [Phytophthora idaei]
QHRVIASLAIITQTTRDLTALVPQAVVRRRLKCNRPRGLLHTSARMQP